VKKIIIIFLFFQTPVYSQNLANVYFGGGCFWCMEEAFEKTEGILETISGYSGGTTENPTYKEVTYGNSGHFEAVKVTYDTEIISYSEVLDIYWKNIDPFDSFGQFCDKGYSYRSVVFFKDIQQKKIIQQSLEEIESKFNKKVVTYVRKFDKFYKAENHHQDYYKENFINYLMYKNGCGRTKILEKIWN